MANNKGKQDSSTLLRLISKAQRRLVLNLTAVLFVFFLGNLALLSFLSEFASVSLTRDGGLNIAIVYAFVLVLIGAAVACIYTWIANSKIDPLRDQARRLKAEERI